MFDATKVRKNERKTYLKFAYFSHKSCKRLHYPYSVETIINRSSHFILISYP